MVGRAGLEDQDVQTQERLFSQCSGDAGTFAYSVQFYGSSIMCLPGKDHRH